MEHRLQHRSSEMALVWQGFWRWSKLDSHPTVGVSAPCSVVCVCHLCTTVMYVCIVGGGGGGQPYADESLSLAEGAGLEGATLGWVLPGSLNHIGAAMGRLPGAWRTEREAQPGDLSASLPFDLCASLERLPPPHLGLQQEAWRGASHWPGTQEASSSCMALLAPVSLSMSLSDLALPCRRCCEGLLSRWARSRTHRWGSRPTLASLSQVLSPHFWVNQSVFLSCSFCFNHRFLPPSFLPNISRPHSRCFKDLGAPTILTFSLAPRAEEAQLSGRV